MAGRSNQRDLVMEVHHQALLQQQEQKPADFDLLGHLENAKESKRTKARKTKGTASFPEINPKDFKDGTSDDGTVETVEGRRKVNVRAQGVQSYGHFEDEGA